MQTLDFLIQRGLTIESEGDKLVVSPKSGITDEVRAFIRENKAAILAELTNPPSPASPAPHSCPDQAPGQATQPGREETGLKTANPGHSDTVAWNSPIFGILEAPILSRDFASFTLLHPLTGEVVTLPNEWIASLEERAAIIEYDGHAPREEADRQARKEFFGLFRRGGKP